MKFATMGELMERTKHATPDRSYFFAIFTAGENGSINVDVHTLFKGWGDDDFRTEIRGPRNISSDYAEKLCADLGIPLVVVHNLLDLLTLMFHGGGGLICQDLAQKEMADHFCEKRCIAPIEGRGFTKIEENEDTVIRRAPNPKLRMNVLKRDGFRCRLCGRSPRDYIDVDLHLHHIRPFSKRGATAKKNLITLCQTCHRGLDPHHDESLAQLVCGPPGFGSLAELHAAVERMKHLHSNL